MQKKQSKSSNPIKLCLIGTDWTANEERKQNNWYGGCTYYRLIKPMLNIEGYEAEYHGADLGKEAYGKSVPEFYDDLVSRFDLFVVKHIDNPEAASALLFCVKNQGKKIILDLDDNLFEVKEDQPAYELYQKNSEKSRIVAALISLVDALFVSTQPLADYYKQFLKVNFNKDTPIFVLPNYNEISDWQFKPVLRDWTKYVIGWAGSTTHQNDLAMVLPAIEKIMHEYPNVYLDLVGGISYERAPELFKDFYQKLLKRVACRGGTLSWQGYPEFMSTLKWDIGIAPLLDDEFNRGKSHIKWMEYGCYKIPTIASKVYPYFKPILKDKTIEDGKTGYLATEDEWYDKLKYAITHKAEATQVGKNAYEYIRTKLQYSSHQKLWLRALKAVQKISE